jgi:hypothetical protein
MTGSYVQHYSLNQVQRELDFNSNKFNSSINTNNKFNNPYYTKNNYMLKNNGTTTKSLSFCNVNNLLSPTAMQNMNEYKPRTITINTNNNNDKFQSKDENYANLGQKINMENIITGKDKRTTLMLRNIPNKYTLQNLVDEINSSFWGKFDYVNLPIDYSVNSFYMCRGN